jgi:hypothetical protein
VLYSFEISVPVNLLTSSADAYPTTILAPFTRETNESLRPSTIGRAISGCSYKRGGDEYYDSGYSLCGGLWKGQRGSYFLSAAKSMLTISRPLEALRPHYLHNFVPDLLYLPILCLPKSRTRRSYRTRTRLPSLFLKCFCQFLPSTINA